MNCITSLFLVVLGCTDALKIAVGDEVGFGLGFGCGSGSGTTPSDVASDSNAVTDGDAVESTVTNSAGKTVKVKVQKFSKAVFKATPKSVASSEGAAASFPIAALDAIEKLTPAGFDTLAITVSKDTPGTPPSKPSKCVPAEVTVTALKSGDPTAKQEIPVTGLPASAAISVTLVGCSKAATCATWKPSTKTWSTSGASGTPPNCKFTELSQKSGIGSAGVTGDPTATNLAGDRFEILAMGTFQLLSINNFNQQSKLTLDATIDRAGEMCGATYIKNISMAGGWIEEFSSLTDVRIRAAPDMPKDKALEVAFSSNQWIKSKDAPKTPLIKEASAGSLKLSVHGVTIQTKIDAHRVRMNGVKTKRFANFLNVDVQGLNEIKKRSEIHLGGLLAYDDHAFAMQAPHGCKTGKLANLKQQLESDDDVQLKFLSSVEIQ